MAASYLAAESALQRFIHAFLCCPAGGRERGDWVTHPSAHWLVLWKCVGNDLSHLALSLSITYTQANAQMLVQSAGKGPAHLKPQHEKEGTPETQPHSHRQKCVTRTHIQIGCTGRFVCTHEHAQTFKTSQNGWRHFKLQLYPSQKEHWTCLLGYNSSQHSDIKWLPLCKLLKLYNSNYQMTNRWRHFSWQDVQTFRHSPFIILQQFFLETSQLSTDEHGHPSAAGWEKFQKWEFKVLKRSKGDPDSSFPVSWLLFEAVGSWEITGNSETVQDKGRGGAQTGQRLCWSLKIIICCVTGSPFPPFIYVKKPSLTGTACVCVCEDIGTDYY